MIPLNLLADSLTNTGLLMTYGRTCSRLKAAQKTLKFCPEWRPARTMACPSCLQPCGGEGCNHRPRCSTLSPITYGCSPCCLCPQASFLWLQLPGVELVQVQQVRAQHVARDSGDVRDEDLVRVGARARVRVRVRVRKRVGVTVRVTVRVTARIRVSVR